MTIGEEEYLLTIQELVLMRDGGVPVPRVYRNRSLRLLCRDYLTVLVSQPPRQTRKLPVIGPNVLWLSAQKAGG